MIAELGHFSLILALIAALIQGFLPLAGTALGVRSWVNVARPAVFANAVFCTFAFCCLAWCFYTSDFSVMNVANNSNSMLPWFYRLSATWGSHSCLDTAAGSLGLSGCRLFSPPPAGRDGPRHRCYGSDFRRPDAFHAPYQ